MTTVFRRIALAAALVVGAGAAQAGVVISFEGLGLGQAVPDSYANSFGVGFSKSGKVYDTSPPPLAPSTRHLGNDSKTSSVLLTVLDGFIYNIFSFDFSHACETQAGTFNVNVVGQVGKSVSSSWSCPTTGFSDWQTANLDLTDMAKISTIEFGFSSSGLFGVDNLRLGTRDTGGGGTVPEPASYGLVAMALLAAGWASRRRAG